MKIKALWLFGKTFFQAKSISKHTTISILSGRCLYIDIVFLNLIGNLATQWTLSPNRRKFPSIHVIPQGAQCGSH